MRGSLLSGRKPLGVAASTLQLLTDLFAAAAAAAAAVLAKNSGCLMLQRAACFLREDQTKTLHTAQVTALVVGCVGDGNNAAAAAAAAAVAADAADETAV